VRHNIPFLASLMQHPRWREGRLSTGFIAEEYPDGFHASLPAGETARTLAAVAAAMDHVQGERKRRISGQMIGRAVTREKRRSVRLGATIPVTGAAGTIGPAFAGVVAGHTLTYFAAFPGSNDRAAYLAATGHSYWRSALVLALLLEVLGLGVVAARASAPG